MENKVPNSSRKLFFGLFVFPLLIAVGMAVLLCTVVLLTNEQETPESLIAGIKTGSPSKRWQKAFELSNELNKDGSSLRNQSVLKEIIHILGDPDHYDGKTRGYMAVALSHFHEPEAVRSLEKTLQDNNEEVRLYSLWALGVLRSKESLPLILPLLQAEREDLRKMAAYVLGVIGDKTVAPKLEPLLEDPVVDVRWNTALALARLGEDSGLAVLLKMLEREELSSKYQLSEEAIQAVMTNATKGLALIQGPESIKILESVSRSDKNMSVRQAAIDALKFKRMENS